MIVYPEWLFEVAPEYFDLENGDFKQNEARRKLERVWERISKK